MSAKVGLNKTLSANSGLASIEHVGHYRPRTFNQPPKETTMTTTTEIRPAAKAADYPHPAWCDPVECAMRVFDEFSAFFEHRQKLAELSGPDGTFTIFQEQAVEHYHDSRGAAEDDPRLILRVVDDELVDRPQVETELNQTVARTLGMLLLAVADRFPTSE
jgi:hypothetical protein